VTTPAAQGRLEHPAVVLVADAGPVDRDGTVDGVPVLAQLAGQLSDEGFVVIRYDKRGVGLSGGRIEMVTLQDYADDVVAAVKWLDKRKDVDDKRISVFGHGEGGAVAMLAAAREKRIAGVAMLGAMGTTGRELILEQQRRLLEDTKVAESERAEKMDLQKQILEATVAGKGWESLPPEVRRAVDTPFYRSLLTFEPAAVMKRIKQPILILKAENDKRVPARHADALAELARARKNSPPVAVESLPGLNHNMMTAGAPGAPAAVIGPEVARALAAWLATVAR
jgi:alpha-beta hydrolase superfamily lysophospholipase